MSEWGVRVPTPTEAEFFNAARPTTFLLVEGGSDERFWLSRVGPRHCKIRVTFGRPKAFEELDTVLAERKSGFVAVLDADCDRLDSTLTKRPDVVWTDLHDLEMMLIASPALEKVLAEVASNDKLVEFEKAARSTVRNVLCEHAYHLGQLRWLSKRDHVDLTFRKMSNKELKYIDYCAFCDQITWKVNRKNLVRKVLAFSCRHELDIDDLLARMEVLPQVDIWQLCVGHDAVGFLMVGLRKKLGKRNLQIEDIQERLRLAFEKADLEKTRMYESLRAWENDNSPFRIFPV